MTELREPLGRKLCGDPALLVCDAGRGWQSRRTCHQLVLGTAWGSESHPPLRRASSSGPHWPNVTRGSPPLPPSWGYSGQNVGGEATDLLHHRSPGRHLEPAPQAQGAGGRGYTHTTARTRDDGSGQMRRGRPRTRGRTREIPGSDQSARALGRGAGGRVARASPTGLRVWRLHEDSEPRGRTSWREAAGVMALGRPIPSGNSHAHVSPKTLWGHKQKGARGTSFGAYLGFETMSPPGERSSS